jgi:hypothetical protein
MALQPATVVRRSALSLKPLPGAAAAGGLEGEVMRCENTPYLCKLYRAPRDDVDAAALQELIDLVYWGLGGADRGRLQQTFSWPLHRVVDDSTLATVGVLIPAAEPRFYFPHAGQWHLREGQHLPRESSVAGSFDLGTRLRVLIDLAAGWDVLARNSLVYGDANSRNIVFATSGSPSVYLLDCDGILREGHPRLGYRAQANWTDPYGGDNSLDSDRYLFALWMLRTLSSSMAAATAGVIDLSSLPSMPGRPAIERLLERGLGAPGSRPTPGECLSDLHASLSAL